MIGHTNNPTDSLNKDNFFMILDESIVPENGGTIPDLLDTIKGDKFKLINKIPPPQTAPRALP